MNDQEQKHKQDIRKYFAEIILSKRAEKKIRTKSFNIEASVLYQRRFSSFSPIIITMESPANINKTEEQLMLKEQSIGTYRSLPSTILDSESDGIVETGEKNLEQEQEQGLEELKTAEMFQNKDSASNTPIVQNK